MVQIVLNKYRNELGRKFRKMYDGGVRSAWCRRSAMRACFSRIGCIGCPMSTLKHKQMEVERWPHVKRTVFGL